MRRYFPSFFLYVLLLAIAALVPHAALAQETGGFIATLEGGFKTLTDALTEVIFFNILFSDDVQFPIIVAWLMAGGIYFTLRLRFVNFRMFGHGLALARGKYDYSDAPGEVTHFQALSAAVSGTVGLGNIAGVAIAVAMGGPGAIVWMLAAGFLGMSLKFTEVTLGVKYRQIDSRGKVSGGAFRYLEEGLKEKNMARLGKRLAQCFAILAILGAVGGGGMFQTNQAVKMAVETFTPLNGMYGAVSFAISFLCGLVLIGGIKRIARVTDKLVPFMAIIYIAGCITVLVANAALIPDAIATMLRAAFTPDAATGGVIGAIVAGFRRACFSNEAGIGSAPMAHAAVKTHHPVTEGCVALLEPFLDTIIVCFLTGLVITVTGVYQDEAIRSQGILLASASFATVSYWFPKVLAVCVVLFAYSTLITWSYYGERAWHYLFGYRTIRLYYVLFCTVIFFGGINSDLGVVVDFSDMALLSMAFPNLIGLYLLQDVVRKELADYTALLKAGKLKKK